MSAFDWTEWSQIEWAGRYAEQRGDTLVRGESAWRRLWERLMSLSQSDLRDTHAAWDDAFQSFLDDAGKESPDADEALRTAECVRSCCVFVSHRQIDWPYAERVAYLAAQHGFQYWLDVHDPTLAAANRLGLASPAKEILIAAIIEMALLNSTHVVAVHTANSAGSKWIPYEMGRVKERRLFSTRTCGWFDPSGAQPAAGEYTFLAVRTRSEVDVASWLHQQSRDVDRTCRSSGAGWPKAHTPPPLP